MSEKPLVSIIVLTYNSSRFIKATLDSIKKQKYPNIELIVSDDSSIDETGAIVEDWLKENGNIFKRTLLLRSYSNRGTSANYNHGIINSHGEYIKVLDGDDLLSSPDAIGCFVSTMKENNWDICISDVEVFSDEDVDLSMFKDLYKTYFNSVSENYEQQKKQIILNHLLPDPGLFMRRSLYDRVGGFDERYVLLEEWPFFLYVLEAGIQIQALPEKLVSYRITKSSISHSGKSKAQLIMRKDLLRFFVNELFKRQVRSGHIIFSIKTFIDYIYRYFLQVF